jgi:hypothetical protein
MAQSIFDLMTNCAGEKDFIAMVQRAQTSQFMCSTTSYRGHIDYYNNVIRGHAFATDKETYPDY